MRHFYLFTDLLCEGQDDVQLIVLAKSEEEAWSFLCRRYPGLESISDENLERFIESFKVEKVRDEKSGIVGVINYSPICWEED